MDPSSSLSVRTYKESYEFIEKTSDNFNDAGISSPLSSYLYQLAPDKYGNKQDDYLARSEFAIQETVLRMQNGVQAKEKLTDVFFEIQPKLSKIRHELAVDHSTEDAPLFGNFRAAPESPPCEEDGYISPLTRFEDSYKKYNRIFMEQLSKIMAPMKRTPKTFDQKEIQTEETILGIKNSCTVKILEGADLFPLLDYPEDAELQSILNTKKSLTEIVKDYALMKELKIKDPKLYERCSMRSYFEYLKYSFPSPVRISNNTFQGNTDNLKNLYAIATVELEIDGNPVQMSRYLTWLYQDFKNDPVERMKNRSTAIVIHQDPFLIDPTLQEIAKVFEKCMLWNREKETLQDLKNRVFLFRFLYANCMPNSRGDGAIGDWLEIALYRFHGFAKTRHNSERLPCFEPLASLSLSHYLERYNQTITVE
jgi:hypothetical protein